MLAMFNKPSVFYLVLLNRNLCLNHGPIQSCCCLLIGKINLLGITILILKPTFIILSPPLVWQEGEEAFLPLMGKPGSVFARCQRDSSRLPAPMLKSKRSAANPDTLPLRGCSCSQGLFLGEAACPLSSPASPQHDGIVVGMLRLEHLCTSRMGI